MKGEDILTCMGLLNDEYILEAAGMPKQKKNRSYAAFKKFAAAACLCLAVLAVFAGIRQLVLSGSDYADMAMDGAAPRVSPEDGHDGSTVTDVNAPVYYSSLKFSYEQTDEKMPVLSENGIMSIAPFDESMLKEEGCCLIIEGIVTNIYTRHYTYDTYNDKFKKNGTLQHITDTVVYEIAVDKTWYGADMAGQTILIEDTDYFTEPVFYVKSGGRYVLPLYEYGDKLDVADDEYASGDIKRDSIYSTVCQYHPQIEVTDDGYYLISKDWTTLTSVNAKDVIMDTEDLKDSYFKNKMCLIDADTFAEQMEILVSRM